MDPSQDVSGRVRTRGSIRRDINKVAHTVEECAGERRQVIDKVACAVKKGAAEREAVLSDMDPDVSGRVRTRGSIRCDINKVARAVEECAGERRRDIDKIACDNGACAVKKGAAEREPALSDMDLSQDVSGRVRTRGSIRRDIDKGSRAVEECPGERRRDIAKDNMATDAGEKGLFVNNGIGDKGCYKNENGTREAGETHTQGKAYGGSYIYNSEMDNYTLEAIGTEEKRPFVLPGEIYRELLQHQVEGIEWLWGIHCQYPGGIVSDDMGLGKTFQASVFLAGLIHSKLVKRAIVIVPLSVLLQWPGEMKKAGIKDFVHVYHDCDDTGLKTVLKKGGILLTTYGTYASKFQKLIGSSKACWDYAILDEAHRIKNINSQITGLMNKIHSKKKILLTGTPIQKDLMDLYSLLNFISPGLLGDEATFRKKYLRPISLGRYANAAETEKEEYIRALKEVRNATTTYLLRRKKKVLIESGHLRCKKHDMVVWLRLTELQMLLYRKFEKIYSNRIVHQSESAMLKTAIWKDICNSPSLLLNTKGDSETEIALKSELLDSLDAGPLGDKVNSCKATFVLDLVKEIFEEEKKEKDEEAKKKEHKDKEVEINVRKILIFSQSLEMLNLIQRFKSVNGPRIFLLSSKVGGEGLNLTVATRVIIVDPSWNSSDDNQISDRVYRMGQKEDVYIYRLVTCRTVEEHAYKTQLLKGALGRGIIEGMTCASSVHKKEGKVLCLPDQKVGFDSSETHHLLGCTKANKLDFYGRHLEFLMSHPQVSGLTNQNFVLSKEETSLSDCPQDSISDELCDGKIVDELKRAEIFCEQDSRGISVTNCHPNKRKDAASKQRDLTTTTTEMSSHVMEVSQSKAALIIGTDGQMIRRIRLLSSADVRVERPRVYHSSSQRIVSIVGTTKEIEKAKQMIMDVISEAKKMLPDEQEDYLYVPVNMVGKVIGIQGRTVKDINQKSGAFVRFVEDKESFSLCGSRLQIDCAKELIYKIIGKTENEISKPQEKYVAVPEAKIGLVIGKQGRMVNEMKRISGAFIKFIDPQNGFLLTGDQQQIDNAEALIWETLNKSCRRGSGHPQHGGNMPTSRGGSFAGSDGSQRSGMTSQQMPVLGNKFEYYGERGPPRPRPPRNG
ncbi:hypothetical protein ACQ4PT_027912 [Festuca glaucescens]